MILLLLALGAALTLAVFVYVPDWFGKRAGDRAVAELSDEAQADYFYACRVFDNAHAHAASSAGALLTAAYAACAFLPGLAGLVYVVYLGVRALGS